MKGTEQLLSRFTWEMPQSFLGYLTGSISNTLYAVKNVAYYGGATVITYKGKFGAFTLGSFINGGRNLHADPDNALFQHEYGHYLQSQNSGLFYIPIYAIPSLVDAASKSNHRKFVTEQDANIRAFKYFHKHAPEFDIGKINGTDWKFSINPIVGYDNSKPIDDTSNQDALKNGLMSWR